MPGLHAVDAALDRTASRMTPIIRNQALDAGWPEEAAARLRLVRSDTGTLALDYDGDHEEARDLEFGTQDQPPRSVLTVFDKTAGRRMVRSTMLDSMDEIHDRIQGFFS